MRQDGKFLSHEDRRQMADDNDRLAHEERHQWLVEVSKGIVNPGADPIPTASPQSSPVILERDEDEDVSRSSLKGFW